MHRPNKSFMHLIENKLFITQYAEYALQSIESGKITFKQIESCRRALRRSLGKSAEIYFNLFTSFPVSSKAISSRMGKVKVPFLIE
jgi:large subunit ribosomal protein L16